MITVGKADCVDTNVDRWVDVMLRVCVCSLPIASLRLEVISWQSFGDNCIKERGEGLEVVGEYMSEWTRDK